MEPFETDINGEFGVSITQEGTKYFNVNNIFSSKYR